MKHKISTWLLGATLATSSTLVGCASTTNTGAIGINRNQLLLVSNAEVQQLAAQSFNETVGKARQAGKLDTNPAQVNRLKRIASRLIGQVGVYRPDAQNWAWEVHTIQSNTINAYVLPGGKIMFYTGIIDRLNLTDDEIAAIMGHEMAHALREHTREKLSQQMATQLGLGVVTSRFGLSQGQAQLAGYASELGLALPNSRQMESEADVMGLELMARAGYNPQAAVSLWRKMQQVDGRGEPPQFLSTHPASATRINNLQALMPRVMPLYQQTQAQMLRR